MLLPVMGAVSRTLLTGPHPSQGVKRLTSGANMINESITIRLRSGRKLKVPKLYERGGLCVTPWIVVGRRPYPAKDYWAITHCRSGAIIVNAPYRSLGEARMVLERIIWLANWQAPYRTIEEDLNRGRLEKLREVLSDEVYQATLQHEDRLRRAHLQLVPRPDKGEGWQELNCVRCGSVRYVPVGDPEHPYKCHNPDCR